MRPGAETARRSEARGWRIGRGETSDQILACLEADQTCVNIRHDQTRVTENAVVGQEREHRGHGPIARRTHRTPVTGCLFGVVVTTLVHGAGRSVCGAHRTVRGGAVPMAVGFLIGRRRLIGDTTGPRYERRERCHLEKEPGCHPESQAPADGGHGLFCQLSGATGSEQIAQGETHITCHVPTDRPQEYRPESALIRRDSTRTVRRLRSAVQALGTGRLPRSRPCGVLPAKPAVSSSENERAGPWTRQRDC
jgi:hypothetical protein